MILVTGGTGTSGKPIVEALLARTERVRVLARDPEKAATLLGPDVEIVRGDLQDPQSIEAAMDGVERALLLTASAPNLLELETNFIKAAESAGVRHVVKFSVDLAEMRFMRVHGQAETALRHSTLAWTMLQPTFFMQNILGYAGMAKSGALYMPTGSGRAPFVDTRDIAAVAAAALTEVGHEGRRYVITGPRSVSIADIAAVLSEVMGREVRHVDVPPEAAKQALLATGMTEWYADGVNELNAGLKAGTFDHVTDTVRTVGKKEPTTLEDFLREHAGVFE
jgi:uncharacterized protein YbjT (DUF2867 family)